jgi:hypothetical protein
MNERLIPAGQEPVNAAFYGHGARVLLRCSKNVLAEYAENMLRNERKLLIGES